MPHHTLIKLYKGATNYIKFQGVTFSILSVTFFKQLVIEGQVLDKPLYKLYNFRIMESEQSLEIPEHYPFATRSLLRLFGEAALTNVVGVDVEPKYGYATRLTYVDGSHRVTYGSDLGLNPGAACDLAKDKGHSKFLLRTIGVNCPAGEEFLLPWWAERIKASLRQRRNDEIKTTDQIASYVENDLGYPAYIKPVSGSKGSGVYKLHAPDNLASAIKEYEETRVSVALVEESINMPDYRMVMLDGALISAYRRTPLTVTGDGAKTIRELIQDKQAEYEAEDRDTNLDPDEPAIQRHLASSNLTIASVPRPGLELALIPTSNLSTGGTSEDVTHGVHSRWADLCTYIADNFNLRLCGVDLACEDIYDPNAAYSIIEVNATPGLDHYAASGDAQKQIVDQLYTKVFNAMPNS